METQSTGSRVTSECGKPPKREYHAPQVEVYGDLRELTQTNTSPTGPDNFDEPTITG